MIEVDKNVVVNELCILTENELIAESLKNLIDKDIYNISSSTLVAGNEDTKKNLTIKAVRKEWLITKAKNIMDIAPKTNILVVINNLSEQQLKDYMLTGIKGVVYTDIEPILFHEALHRVSVGTSYLDPRIMTILIENYREMLSFNGDIRFYQSISIMPHLTNREIDVLLYIAEGLSNIEMTEKLFISEKSVKNHVSNILQKFEVANRSAAVAKALKNGWISI